jgi:SAM-dependent methyltransferase
LFYLHRQLLLDALAKASPRIRGVLLDVGCRDKPFEQYFGATVTRWLGCDLPSYAGEIMRPDTYGKIEQLPFAADSFDTVLCTEMLYMMSHPERAAAELYRVTKPGGYLVLSASQQAIESAADPDYYRFTRFALEALAREAGFVSTELYEVGGAIAMVLFATFVHLGPLRARNPIARAASTWVQHMGVLADRRWRQPRDAIGWVLVAGK